MQPVTDDVDAGFVASGNTVEVKGIVCVEVVDILEAGVVVDLAVRVLVVSTVVDLLVEAMADY